MCYFIGENYENTIAAYNKFLKEGNKNEDGEQENMGRFPRSLAPPVI